MLGKAIAGALIVGPFSGVSVNNITDTPMLVQEALIEVTGADLLGHGQGMKAAEYDGESVAETGTGFFLEVKRELPPGRYGLQVDATAPSRGSDSYWVELDGERIERPFTIPVNALGKRTFAVTVEEAGEHAFRLVLREGAGSVLKSVSLFSVRAKTPRAPMREELRGKHPRIFFTVEELTRLRERAQDERVRRYYEPASPLTKKPPAFKPGKRNGGSFRSLGSYAFSHLMAPDEAKLEGVLKWLERATTYPHCGADLDAEYFTEGVALAYDWLYDEIPTDLRERVRDTLARQCRHVYEESLTGRQGGGLSFQQNHYWYAHLALALGAAAICDEVPEAEEWLAWAWDRFERIALTFSPDGGFHEGPAYWDFSMPTLYLYTDLYEWCTGLHIPAGDDGLHGQAEFRFHQVYPGMQHSAPLEDTTHSIARPPIRLLLWEAKRFRDPVPQGIAQALNGEPHWLCWNLLWLDETLEAATATKVVEPARYYPDIETVFVRTSWDDDATFAAFVSRPLGGHRWAELCDKFGLGGTGHNHPEQNHFVLFGRGEVLVGDPGYTYKKETRNHNTVLVDGKGQYGDGEMWPHPTPGRAHLTHFTHQGDVTIAVGEAASAYPAELALKRCERTFVMAGRDLVVVRDRLAAEQPRTFSWLLHHYGDGTHVDRTWTVTRGKAQLTIVPLLPAEIDASQETYRPVYVHPTRDHTPKDADLNMIELKTGPVAEATFLVPLLVGDRGAAVPRLEDVTTATHDAVRVGDTVVAFAKGDGGMSVAPPWGGELKSKAAALVARIRDGEREVVEAMPVP